MNKKNNKFNKFLELYESYIDECDTTNLSNIFSIHNKINKYINENNEIEINIINNYLDKNKNSEEKSIKKMITFIELKNKHMINEAKKLDSWNEVIENLYNKYKIINNIEIEDKNIYNKIEKYLIKLLLMYKNKFNGSWDIIITDKNGKPKKIELLDPNYINYIYENIK
jgi:hypothetical protein